MNSELIQIRNFLKWKEISITEKNEWLKSCVSCFKSQGTPYKLTDLQNFVYEQWLLADLREIQAGSFPRDIQNQEKLILSGKFAVQINYAVNVAISFHKQLQKIRRPESQFNLEVDGEEKMVKEPSGSRALKFELTDGVTTVNAFEDRPIKSIKEIVPGEKAILKGPLEVRKGILMLKENNINLIGGEVDTLHVPNAVENILARALNLPENPDPYKQKVAASQQVTQFTLADCLEEDEETLMKLAETIENEEPILRNPTTNYTNTVNNFVTSNTQSANNIRNNLSTPQTRKQSTLTNFIKQVNPPPQKPVQTSIPSNILDDGFDFPDDDFELMVTKTSSNSSYVTDSTKPEISRTYSASVTVDNSKSLHSSPEMTNLNDPLILRKKLEESYNIYNLAGSSSKLVDKKSDSTEEKSRTTSVQPLSKANVETSSSSFECDKVAIDYFSDDNLLSELSQFPFEESQELSEGSTPDFYQPFPPKTYPSERRVHGKVVKLSQKLGIKDENWSLSAIVSAKGMEMEMDFSSQVLDKIFGMTGKELSAKRKEFKINPEVKEKMNEILRNSQHRIKNLNCDMVIKFNSFISNPVIIDIDRKK